MRMVNNLLRPDRRASGWVLGALIAAFCAAAVLLGMLQPFDRMLADFRFSLDERRASESLVLVEIDSRSLKELDTWPWPREYHARAIERLLDAGVTEIAYDVDFSSRATEEGDAALEAALERGGRRVILPVFHQSARAEDARIELVRTTPLPRFAQHVQLGGVTLIPSPDGLVRQMATADVVPDPDRPGGEVRAVATMPTLLAGPSALGQGIYMIDYAIDPSSIPRVSFVDLIEGRAAADMLRDRKAIVGARATELGDLHAVPVHRILPGPTIQALGYESLVQGRALHWLSGFTTVILVLLLTFGADNLFRRLDWRLSLPILLGTALVIEAVAVGVQHALPIVVPTAGMHLGLTLAFVAAVLFTVESKALLLFRQRMATAHRRRLMAMVLQESFDGVAITDTMGRFEVFNRAAGEILGTDPEVARLGAMTDFIPELDELVGDIAADETAGPFEVRVTRGDGTPIVLEIACTRLELSPSPHPLERRTTPRPVYSYIFRDVTERSRAAAAARKAKEAAIAANNAKTSFLANMSHELRSPLNAIIGFGEMIESEYRGPIDPKYRDYANGIVQSGRHLLSVINDILHISKIESGNFSLQEDVFDLAQMVSNCLSISRGWTEINRRTLVTALPDQRIELYGDETLLRQSVINLLSNAVKYSRPGDRVSLRVMRSRSNGVIIEIGDTGIGIEEEQIPMLTKPFYQVDSALSRKFEGTGLGLALVNAYVKAHDGKVDIKSTLGVGTTIRIILPPERVHRVFNAPPSIEQDAPTDGAPAGGARIDSGPE
jgi:signal transduction histidine kinase